MHTTTLTRRGFHPVSAFDLFDRFFNELAPGVPARQSEETSNRSWTPAVDLKETDEAFLVSIELPGLTKEDVDISLEDNILSVSGERRFDKESENDNYHRIERSYGQFRRSFTLPTTVDGTAVSASFENGVLSLQLPKSAAAKPRKIAIS